MAASREGGGSGGIGGRSLSLPEMEAGPSKIRPVLVIGQLTGRNVSIRIIVAQGMNGARVGAIVGRRSGRMLEDGSIRARVLGASTREMALNGCQCAFCAGGIRQEFLQLGALGDHVDERST